MLSGSTLLRVIALFVVAAGLAGLVQTFWSRGGDDPVRSPQVQRTDPAKPDQSKPDRTKLDQPKPDQSKSESSKPDQAKPERPAVPAAPAGDTAALPQPASPQPSPQPAPNPQSIAPPSPIRPLSRPAVPPAAPEAQANAALSPAPAPSTALSEAPPLRPPPTETQAAVDSAADTAGPRAISVVDLNTGSLADLNGLKGGGMIGRAIVQRRPYTSVDQLLSKRVLSRSTYERIKDQVTVR